MSLTDVAIRKAKPKTKAYKLGDSLGLFLLVQPSGGRLWRMKYRVDGREKKLGLGTYPEIGLAEARRRRVRSSVPKIPLRASPLSSARSANTMVRVPGRLLRRSAANTYCQCSTARLAICRLPTSSLPTS